MLSARLNGIRDGMLVKQWEEARGTMSTGSMTYLLIPHRPWILLRIFNHCWMVSLFTPEPLSRHRSASWMFGPEYLDFGPWQLGSARLRTDHSLTLQVSSKSFLLSLLPRSSTISFANPLLTECDKSNWFCSESDTCINHTLGIIFVPRCVSYHGDRHGVNCQMAFDTHGLMGSIYRMIDCF